MEGSTRARPVRTPPMTGSLESVDLVTWARELAHDLLAEALPRRWAHTQGVARRADSIAAVVGDDADMLVSAAWLHDIGYAPALVDTGFHPLDGARYLRAAGADELLCRLVAHHSCAIIEARRRGLADVLSAEFAPADGLLTDALIYCDMSTSPDGDPVDFDTRLAEIADRYGPGHLVTASMTEAAPRIKLAERAIEMLLAHEQDGSTRK